MSERHRSPQDATVELWRSAGVLVYRRTVGEILWIVVDSRLTRARHHWEFPKGLVAAGESEEDAAVRECQEECGIRLSTADLHPEFREVVTWTLRRKRSVRREVTYFFAETRQEETSHDQEIQEVRWCSTEEALEVLAHDDTRRVLHHALYYLEN